LRFAVFWGSVRGEETRLLVLAGPMGVSQKFDRGLPDSMTGKIPSSGGDVYRTNDDSTSQHQAIDNGMRPCRIA
jgi:hypothetical protein